MFVISERTKIAQKTSLELLKAFVNICGKYNLRYYIGGGTMLGAIRHKGFIPWDDDADIDMPRKDYQKFLKLADNILKQYPDYEIINYYRHNGVINYIRFGDKKVKLKYKNGITPYCSSLWIDIVPIDGVPDNAFLRKLHIYRLKFLKGMYYLSILKDGEVTDNANVKVKRKWYKKLIVFLGKKFPVEKIVKCDTWIKKYDKALTKYSFDDCKMAGTLMSYHKEKSIFPVEWYGKGTKYQFEDIEVIGVDNYDSWLTQLYGDYMKLPDEKERTGHNFELIDGKEQV